MIRIIDFFLASFGLFVVSPLMVLIYFGLLITGGRPIFIQKRLGKSKVEFILYKFRTMKINTKSQPTHLVSLTQVTSLGNILRKSKLDELPQLWNVLLGEMSLVGPRPCLSSQLKLISARSKHGVFSVRPGVTGLAQISDINMSTPDLLAETDAKMIKMLSLSDYFYYIFMTILGKGRGDRVKS